MTQCEHRSNRGITRCERPAKLRVTSTMDGSVRFLCGRHVGEYRRLESRFVIEPIATPEPGSVEEFDIIAQAFYEEDSR
jgi:hypothetical protein